MEPNGVEPQGADGEEDLAPMPDLEEYARILQRLAIEQEQDRINQLQQNLEPEVQENLQASPPVTPKMKKIAGLMILLHRRMSLIPNSPSWRHLLSKLLVM